MKNTIKKLDILKQKFQCYSRYQDDKICLLPMKCQILNYTLKGHLMFYHKKICFFQSVYFKESKSVWFVGWDTFVGQCQGQVPGLGPGQMFYNGTMLMLITPNMQGVCGLRGQLLTLLTQLY